MTLFNAVRAADALYRQLLHRYRALSDLCAGNVAHANDRAAPDEYVTISSGISVALRAGHGVRPVGRRRDDGTRRPVRPLWFLALAFAMCYAGARLAHRHAQGKRGARRKTDFQSIPLPVRGSEPTCPPTAVNRRLIGSKLSAKTFLVQKRYGVPHSRAILTFLKP